MTTFINEKSAQRVIIETAPERDAVGLTRRNAGEN
jgi:hypothetical protein